MAKQADMGSADAGRDSGSRRGGWPARAALVVSAALLAAVDIRRTSDSDVMTVSDWNRLFAYARQHMPNQIDSAVRENATHTAHLLREHATGLMSRVDGTALYYASKVLDALHDSFQGVSAKVIQNTMIGLNKMGTIAAVCDGAIGTVSGRQDFFPACLGEACKFQDKLISVSQSVAHAMNGTNNIVIQNETINRMSEVCIGQMSGLMQQLIINITSVRI